MLPIPARGGGGPPTGGLSNLLPIASRGGGTQQSVSVAPTTEEGPPLATKEDNATEDAPSDVAISVADVQPDLTEKPKASGLLPIPGRGTSSSSSGGTLLPIAGRSPAPPAPTGLLPIPGRGDSTNSAPSGSSGLPIPSRSPAPPAPSGLLPIPGRGDSTNSAPSGSSGLPIASRGGSANSGDTSSHTDVHVEIRNHVEIQDVKLENHSRRGSVTSRGRQRQLMDDYVVGEILGEGAFSIVYACTTKAGYGDYAVKMVDKIESPLEVIKLEVELLEGLKHPNVVNFVEVFYEKCFVCIVLDRYPGGDLFNGMQLHWEDRGRIPCHKVVHLKRQMFSAVTFLHNEDVMHRDVKGDNYLLDRYDIVDPECHLTLTDFGSACRIKDGQRLSELVGTRTYWAPELFKKDYGKKADDWAVGIVVCGLLTGAFPFNGDESVRDPERPAKIAARLPSECLELVKGLLAKDERIRITSTQAAEHPWMVSDGKEDEDEMDALSSERDSPTHKPTKSCAAARETLPDEDVRDRRMELFERLEIEAQRRSTLLGARASVAGKEERLLGSRFLVPNRRERKQYGYEWWPMDKAVEQMGKEELGFKRRSAQVLRRGDHVRIIKESRCKGKTAVVIQPYWHGLVKVHMDEDDPRGMIKSFKLPDLEPCEAPKEESRFKEGDRVLILKDTRDSSMKGKSAIVTDPSTAGLVQVRVEEEDPMATRRGMQRTYRPDCLELDCSEDAPKGKLVAGIDTLGTANVNVQVIGQMLHDHGIETSKWGQGQAKPLKSLAQEVQNGTSQLMLDATQHRTLVRVVNIVLLRICYTWKGETRFLVEASEHSPEGWTRTKPRLIGTKKEPHENTKLASHRALENYLPDAKVNFNFEGTEVFEEEEDSPSYPGMRTVYRKEIVEGWVTTKNEEILERIGFKGAAETPTWGFKDQRGNTKVFEWLTDRQCEKRDVLIQVPDEWDEISCLVNPSATGLSEEKLGEALRNSDIDPEKLAKTPGAKKLEDLVDETKRGECTFVMEPDGRVLRMVDIVLLKLTKADPENPGKSMILVQADEAPMDYPEEKKILARLPGNKLKPTENEFLIARSILSRKLGIDENYVSLNPDDVVTSEEAKTSNSYPGLLTYYRKRMITAQVIMPKSEGESTTPIGLSPQSSTNE